MEAQSIDVAIMVSALLYRLVKISLAFLLLFFILRSFDLISARRFQSSFDNMLESSIASAIYYGLRFVGAAYLVASTWGV